MARSADLNTSVTLIGALVTLAWIGPSLMDAMQQNVQALIVEAASGKNLNAESLRGVLAEIGGPTLKALLGMILVLMAVGVLTTLAQVGWMISGKALEPKWDKMDPLQGLKRLFSLGSVATLLTGILKLMAVGLIAYTFITRLFPTFQALSDLHPWEIMPYTGEKLTALGWRIAIAMLAIGLIDYLFQWWRTESSLKMSKQEVKDERKQEDGDPLIKQRVRQIQRERAMQRMMEEVPKATVVITNPTHVAVALRYEPEMGAPVVVAKGERLIAQRIKEIAYAHQVPVLERPPLARALLRATEIGREIPAEFYHAIAQILAVIMRDKNQAHAPLMQPLLTHATSGLGAGLGHPNAAAQPNLGGRPQADPNRPIDREVR